MASKQSSTELADKVRGIFGEWQTGQNVEKYFHDEYSVKAPVSTVAPLHALFKPIPASLKGKALFNDWLTDFTSFVQPLEMEIVSCAQDGDVVFVTMRQNSIFFNSIQHEWNITSRWTFKDGLIFFNESNFDIKPLEQKFIDLQTQKKANLEALSKLVECFTSSNADGPDVDRLMSLVTDDMVHIMPQTDVAPWCEFYKVYPKGQAGLLEWLQTFGKFFKVESIRCVESAALDAQTTISEWKIIGNTFGAWDNEEMTSTWKHTWKDGKYSKAVCCDVLDKIMRRSSPTQNLALFNQCFQAWATGDTETVLSIFADDYTFDCPISNVAPLSNVFKKYTSTGKAAVVEYLEGQKKNIEFKSCKPTQLAAVKDRVYVTYETEEVWGGKAKVKGSNQWIWTFKDGKVSNIKDLTDLNKYESKVLAMF